MKTVKFEELVEAMRFLNVSIPLLADRTYYQPSLQQVKDFLKNTWFEKYKYIAEKFDCDDYALILHAFIVQERYYNDDSYQWAIGQAWGIFNGVSHAMNVVYTDEDKFMLIEPQTDKIREVNLEKDDFNVVLM